MKAIYLGILLIVSGVLTGCGGSAGSAGPTSSTVAKVAITPTNQSTITNAAINSATQSLGGGLNYVGGVQTTTVPTADHELTKWTDFALMQLAAQQNKPLSVAGVVVATQQCTNGGTITIDTDGTNTTTPTYLTIAFNNCVEGTTTGNGTISLSNLTLSPSTGTPTSIAATFAYNFTVSNATTSAGIYGGFTIAATGINTTSRVDSISGTSLNYKYGSKFETLTNFAFTTSYDNTTLSHGYSDTVDYTFASDVILVGFDFHTINALVRNVGDVKPRSGQVIITGANSSKLRVTVLPYDVSTNPFAGTMSGKVTLELDQGTGYGSAVTKTWTQLANNT